MLAPALRSRKRLSPQPFRPRLWSRGSLTLRQHTAAITPTHRVDPAWGIDNISIRGAIDVNSDNSA